MYTNPVGGSNDSVGGVGSKSPGDMGTDWDPNASDVMTQGVTLMFEIMAMLSQLAKGKFQEISKAQALARKAQRLAADIQAEINAMLAKGPETKSTLTSEQFEELQKLGITVDGESVRNWVMGQGGTVDASGMARIKAAVDNFADTKSDWVSQRQIQVQQALQSYNIATSMCTQMVSMTKEMLAQITNNIR